MERKCYICGNDVSPIFSGIILKKFKVNYFHCANCGYICTENPYWLSESYQNSINVTDTGLLARNIYLSKISASILFLFFGKNNHYLDYGGGYGVLTRLMRDIGFDFYWYDPFTKNLFARGFEYSANSSEIELITSFENFEHFVNPIEDLEKMFLISKNIIFSTELMPNPIPQPEKWWYYGLEHGQHVSFYTQLTLQTIARRFGVHCYSYNNIHLFTPKKLNKTSWKFVCKFGIQLLFPLIQRKMDSKTIEDMNFLK